jgi:hypothetical protein
MAGPTYSGKWSPPLRVDSTVIQGIADFFGIAEGMAVMVSSASSSSVGVPVFTPQDNSLGEPTIGMVVGVALNNAPAGTPVYVQIAGVCIVNAPNAAGAVPGDCVGSAIESSDPTLNDLGTIGSIYDTSSSCAIAGIAINYSTSLKQLILIVQPAYLNV